MVRISFPCPERQCGFTLVELITVLILVGILAVAAAPRFVDRIVFDEQGFHDAVKAALQHARRVAIASRRYVCVTTTPGTGPAATVAVSIATAPPEADVTPVACATDVNLPVPGPECAAANQVCAPNGVILGGASAIFDPLGRSVSAGKALVVGDLVINVSHQPDITIGEESGWIQ